ncbi:MAG: hypothetical protein LUG91_04255 [Ruminococcus sp.]|nr:hypothetical protein [Ruminococcus sp.]
MGGIDFVPEKFTFKVEKYNYYSQDSADEAVDSNNNDSENDERYKN